MGHSSPEVSVSAIARVNRTRQWCANVSRRISHRLGVTCRGWCALGAGILALSIAVAVVGGVSEDVTRHNGLASSDMAHLRFFAEHRPDSLVQAARIDTDFGNVAILVLVAIGAGLLLWRRGLPVVATAA